jgi:signal transduction histidine kinase
MAAAYKKMEKYDLALLHLDSCILYAKKCSQKNVCSVWQGIALENKGQILMFEKKYEEAIHCFQQSIPFCKDFGEYGTQATALMYIGKCLSETPQTLAQAQFYFDSAAAVSLRLDITSKTPQLLKYHLAEYYAKIGNYQKAYENHLRYTQIQDSLEKNLNRKESEELQVQYESEKKDQEIEHQKQTIQFQERQTLFVLLGIAVVISFALYLFYTNRQKQKINRLLGAKKAEIEQIAKELEQLADFKNTMMGMIVHDFKSPLQRTLFYIEQNYKADTYLLKSVQNVLRMVNDLLKIQHIAKNDLELEKNRVQTEGFLKEIMEDQQLLLQKKNIELSYQTEQTWLEMDFVLIRRVLENLFLNAYKYTPEGGKVVFWAKKQKKYFEIAVQDNGQGISAEKLPHIFEAYYQAEAKNELGKSLGLGLAFCKMAVEKHEGRIELESEIGKGTCIRFYLPLSEMQDTEKEGISLSEAEKEQLASTIIEIENTPFFEWTLFKEKIENLPSNTEGLEKWKKELEKTFLEDNESLFWEILKTGKK